MQTRREQMEFCTLFSTVSALGGNSHDLSVCENRESLGSAEEQTARTKLKMNALATQRTFATLQNYAGRFDPSHLYPLVQLKDGVKMWIEGEKEPIYALGGACSEVFGHGRQLEKINRPACKLIGDVYRSWGSGNPAESLSTHTSKGISMHLNGFLNEIERHIPSQWSSDEWILNLQVEGASAVWAGVDLLLQLNVSSNAELRADANWRIGVAELAYHGPGSTSLGTQQPLGAHPRQIAYPVPSSLFRDPGESLEDVNNRAKEEFDAFLNTFERQLKVLIVEPQRGSSACGETWDVEILKYYIDAAKERGILVCADEIMCGLGRHGNHSIFLSEALNLNVDAVTFGKAISGGTGDLLSGVIVRQGQNSLIGTRRTALQSHTYAGSSARALLTATEVLKEVPLWYDNIDRIDDIFRKILLREAPSDIEFYGSGAMWGGRFTGANKIEQFRRFQESCSALKVSVYEVDRLQGFMMTPPYDVTREELTEGTNRLKEAIELARQSHPCH
jgi:adenosylmethionine-8-amino-7-oxononanoate aminotransferase